MSYMRAFEIPPQQKNEVVIVGGGSNPELTASISESIGLEPAEVDLKRHANDELYARIDESIRGKDVFVVQSHCSNNGYKLSETVMEHMFLVSAAAGARARSVTAIAPYLAHSRGDRKSRGREVVPAPLVIQWFESAGKKTDFSMMSVDVHAQQTTENLRTGTYEHLTAQPELRRAVRKFIGPEAIKRCVVISPDAGAVKNNNRHAQELSMDEGVDIDVIFMGKERAREDSTRLTRGALVGGVDGRICVTFDDMIDGGSTMVSAAEALKESGADKVYVAATHPVFSGSATDKLMNPAVDGVFVTDTLPVGRAKEVMGDKLQVVPIGPLIGRAIYEISTNGSISKLFDDQNHR